MATNKMAKAGATHVYPRVNRWPIPTSSFERVRCSIVVLLWLTQGKAA